MQNFRTLQQTLLGRREERSLMQKIVAYLSCSTGRTHFDQTKTVAYLSCSTGRTHFGYGYGLF
jgi:hypothetical protein